MKTVLQKILDVKNAQESRIKEIILQKHRVSS